MADDVEKRVVKMEFDNSKFDKNVKKSSNTLDEFKEKLQFKDVSKSMDKVCNKFKALDIATYTVINNITNRIVNLGIQMVKSLSVDNISSGWDKFGDKTVAVGTMVSQTLKVAGKELTNYSEKITVINEQLEKLNWFTDETSYSFTTMVDTIGKFTAAGQDLDKSVAAMMGIANWAAMSGQNAQKASMAMTQLAQAMGRGYIMVQDWQSIENVGMATGDFQKRVLETAVAMGELTKQGEMYITKTGKKFEASAFRSMLSGKWFTTDVLINTLEQYSAAVEEIYEISEREGITARQVIEKYGKSLDKFGVQAFQAAQEARTFTDVINSIKDAVSTGWMNTFENIFGGYDEAKTLWSDLADSLYEVFVEGGNFRNNILRMWDELAGRSDLFEHGSSDQGAFWNIYDSMVEISKLFKKAKNAIFPISSFESENDQVNELARNFKKFTSALKDATSRTKQYFKENEKIQDILTGLMQVFKIIASSLMGVKYALDPILDLVKDIVSAIFDRIAVFGKDLAKVEGITEKIESVSKNIASFIRTIVDTLRIAFASIPEELNKLSTNFTGKGVVKNLEDFFVALTGGTKEYSEATKELQKTTKPLMKMAGGQDATNVYAVVESSMPDAPSKGEEKKVEEKATGLIAFINGVAAIFKGIAAMFTTLVTVVGNTLKIIGDALVNIAKFIDDLISGKLNTLVIGIGITVAVIAAVVVGVIALTHMLQWAIQAFAPLSYNLENLTDSLYTMSASKWWGSVAKLIGNIGDMLLELAISLTLIAAIPTQEMWKPLLVLGIISGVLIALAVILNKTSKSASAFGLAIKNFNVAFQGSLENLGKSIKFAAIAFLIKKFAESLLIVAVACALLSSIPVNNIWSAVIVFATVGGAIVGIMAATKIMALAVDEKSIKAASKSIKTIGATMLVMVASIKLLASSFASAQDARAAWTAFGIIELLLHQLAGLLIGLNMIGGVIINSGESIHSVDKEISNIVVSLIGMVVAIKLLANEFKSSKDAKAAWTAFGVINALMAGLIGVILLLNAQNKTILGIGGSIDSVGKTILLLSTSLIAIVLSIKLLANEFKSSADAKAAWVAFGMVEALLASLVGFVLLLNNLCKELGNGSSISGYALLIGSMVTSLLVIVGSIALLSNILSTATGARGAWAGLAMIEIMLASVIGLLAFLQTVKIDKSVLIGLTTMMGALSGFMLAFAGALSIMGQIKLVNMASIGIAIFGMLTVVGAIAGLVMLKPDLKSAIAVSGLLTIIAGFLFAFAGSMSILAKIPWQSMLIVTGVIIAIVAAIVGLNLLINPENILPMAASLGIMAAALLIFAGALMVFNAVPWDSLLKAGITLVAIIAVLIAASKVSVGVKQFAISMLAIASALILSALALTLFGNTFLEIVESVVENGETIIEFFNIVVEAISTALNGLISNIGPLIQNICEQIIDSAPAIGDTIITLVRTLLKVVKETVPDLLKTLAFIIDELFKFLKENIGKWVRDICTVIVEILDGLTASLPELIRALMEFLVTFIEESVKNLCNGNLLRIVNALITLMLQLIHDLGVAIKTRSAEFVHTFIEFGLNLMAGLWNGIIEGLAMVLEAIPLIGKAVGNGLRNALQIHSPSKMTKEMGVYLMEGFAVGMKESTDETAKQAVGAMNKVVSAVSDTLDSSIDDGALVISPVMDLSNISQGAKDISSMMSSISGNSVSVTGNLAASAARSIGGSKSINSENQNGSTVVNNGGDVYNSTFNITTDDPEEFAREADILLQRERYKANLAKGGVK